MNGGDLLTFALGFLVAIWLLIYIIRNTGEYLNAAVLFSIIWAANIACCIFLPYQELRLQFVTLVVAIAAWWLVLVGFLVGISLRLPLPRDCPDIFFRRGVALLVVLIGLQVVSIVLEVKHILSNSETGSLLLSFSDLPKLRLSGIFNEEMDIPRIWRLWRWNYALYLPLAFVFFKTRVIRLHWLVFVIFIAFISSVLKFTRAPVLHVIIICIVGMGYVRSRATDSWRGGGRSLVLSLAILLGFGILFFGMQAALENELGLRGNRTSEVLLAYVGGPLRAYEDVLLKGELAGGNRYYTLDFVDFVLFKVGLKQEYEGLVRPYANISVLTNVYTYLDVFTLDAGVPGALFGSLALGLLVGWLFDLTRRKGGYWGLAMYSYAAYNFVMAGMNNQFIHFGFLLNAIFAWLISVGLTANLKYTSSVKSLNGVKSS